MCDDKNETKHSGIEDDYNPFDHRKVEKPNSDLRSTANLIKSSLGSGLLAGPLAFANAGWGVGLVLTIIVGVICGHCIHMLVRSSRECCKRDRKPMMTYAETCRSAFVGGPKPLRKYAGLASFIAEFALTATYLGVCCIYTILIADSTKQLMDEYYPTGVLSVEYYCLIFLIPLCIFCQIKYLKWLAIFSLLANVLLVCTYLICLYYIFRGELNISERQIAGQVARYPAFLSTVIFAMEGVGVVMPVENTMKKPKHFLGCPSVLVVAMSIIVFLYATLGTFGYLRYGDALQGSITLTLPVDEWPAICAKIAIAISIFLTFPLQFYVVMDIFLKYTKAKISKKYLCVSQVVIRVIGVCFCVGVGVALPLLEHIINIVGALFYSILGVIIPAVIDTIIQWNNLGRFNWVLWKNTVIIAFGLLCLVSGCTVTINDIITILSGKTI